MRAVFERLALRLTLVHYDGRGTGHSQRDVTDLSLEAMVRDLEAVIDQAGLAKVSLLGQYNSCPHAIAYAARHPEIKLVHQVVIDPSMLGDEDEIREAACDAFYGDPTSWEIHEVCIDRAQTGTMPGPPPPSGPQTPF